LWKPERVHFSLQKECSRRLHGLFLTLFEMVTWRYLCQPKHAIGFWQISSFCQHLNCGRRSFSICISITNTKVYSYQTLLSSVSCYMTCQSCSPWI
jgi:hypothetical protein